MASQAQLNCHHLMLKKTVTGTLLGYRCVECGQNFQVPAKLEIKVEYPGAIANKEQT